ncbi:hypothetical protein BG004_008187 [Podila humilis]|nr:hypothetical protein BG004_008187 [Podila humilis]
MFTSSQSGTSAPRAQSQSNTYVPSLHIRNKLQREHEAALNRQEGGGLRVNGSDRWPGPHDVLEPGYNADLLGYVATAAPSTSSKSYQQHPPSRQIVGEVDQFYDADTDHGGAGSGLGLQDTRKSHTATSMLHPDFHGAGSSSAGSLHTSGSTQTLANGQSPFAGFLGHDLAKSNGTNEDTLKKSTSVRFSGIPDGQRQQPTTPSVYGASGSSPFFTGGSGLSNMPLGSSDKESEKIDVLSHRSAPGPTALNRSLGPAPGSVSGTSHTTQQGYAPQRTQSGDVIGLSSRDGSGGYSVSGSTGVKSPFLLGQDGSVRRQPNGMPIMPNKGLNDEEEDKDQGRYIPGFLLHAGQGLKGTKVEPFMDANGNAAFSELFQQDGSDLRDAYPRQANQQLSDDAPPQDTLDDLARKESFYQLPRPIQFESPKSDTRQETFTPTRATAQQSKAEYDTVITFGFPAEAASYILNQFRSFGTVIRHRTGLYSSNRDAFNWLMIQYNSVWAAKNASTRHLKPMGKFYVGVFPYPPRDPAASTLTVLPDASAMDVDMIENDLGLSEAETLELNARVNALMAMRDLVNSGMVDLSKSQWNGPSSESRQRLGRSQQEFGASFFRGSTSRQEQQQLLDELGRSRSNPSNNSDGISNNSNVAVGATVTSAGVATSSTARNIVAGDAGEEDLSFLLGHSISSGGAFGRSQRRELNPSPLSKDSVQTGSSVGDMSSNTGNGGGGDVTALARGVFGESMSLDDGRGGKTRKEESVGFKPLFGMGESRGLNTLSTGNQDKQTHQQNQFQQQQEQQQYKQEQLTGSHRLSVRRQFEDGSVASGPIFGASGTTLFGGGVGSSTLFSAGSSSPVMGSTPSLSSSTLLSSSINSGIQKKQRLTLNTFSASAPAAANPASFPIDRKSLLVDNPLLVDEYGRPKVAGATGAATNGARAGPGAVEAPSMIGEFMTSVKKRLFWG